MEASGAVMNLPPQGLAGVMAEGLDPLVRRGLVDAQFQPADGGRALLDFYAASVPEIADLPQRGRHKITK